MTSEEHDAPRPGWTPRVVSTENATRDVPSGHRSFWAELSTLNGLAAIAVGLAAGLFAVERPVATAVGAFLVTWVWNRQLLRMGPHVQFLPLLLRLQPLIAVGGTVAGLTLVDDIGLAGAIPPLVAIGAGLLSAVLSYLPGWRARHLDRTDQLRVAVIGSGMIALDLRDELMAARRTDVRVLGHIAPDHRPAGAPGDWELGRLGGLAEAIDHHRIHMLLLSDEAPRMAVFDEVAETCSDSGVRMQELHSFYEQTFGHVPLGRINAAWFQWVMHPNYRVGVSPLKRSMDLLITAVVCLFALPLLGLLALIVRRDGGPAFFTQPRVGENGETFQIYKLRSMRVADPSAGAIWTVADDERITRIGQFLRRTHLDELPQVLNVLRGEMSIVGPRPEQPAYVRQLEVAVPHYSRRNIARPGITGWAQVKCGYAGSDEGSTWKLSHDLYYLKHGSLTLDLLILGETLRTLIADRQFKSEFSLPRFVQQREVERLRQQALGEHELNLARVDGQPATT